METHRSFNRFAQSERDPPPVHSFEVNDGPTIHSNVLEGLCSDQSGIHPPLIHSFQRRGAECGSFTEQNVEDTPPVQTLVGVPEGERHHPFNRSGEIAPSVDTGYKGRDLAGRRTVLYETEGRGF